MTNLVENPVYEPAIYELATTDPLLGGQPGFSSGNPVTGHLNAATQQLTNRVAYIKIHLDNLETGTTIPPTIAPLNSPTFTGTVGGITKGMVGLPNVDNTSDSNKPVSNAQQTALDLKANIASPTFTGTVSGITKSMVGLSNVDNTSDINKPVSTAQQTALNLKANLASPSLTGTPLSTTPAVGTNTTQIATAAMIQAEIANKRAWTTYTPTITSGGTFTAISATGRYMVAFGICYVQIAITITTVGTGNNPVASLPFPALAGSVGYTLPAKASAVGSTHGGARITSNLLGVAPTRYDNGDFTQAGEVILIMGHYPIA